MYEDMCYNLVGYKNSLGATTFAVVLTAVMLAVSLAVTLVSAVSASRAKTMRLVSSKRELIHRVRVPVVHADIDCH